MILPCPQYLVYCEMAYKYSNDYLAEMAAQSKNMVDMMRRMGHTTHSGAMQTHLKNRLIKAGVDLSHWVRGSTGLIAHNRRQPEDIFKRISAKSIIREPAATLRRELVKAGIEYKCANEKCSISSWCDKPIQLQVDHIDGDWRNNEFYNLRFLCPNCHTQTETWGYSGPANPLPKKETRCRDCDKIISQTSERCTKCNGSAHEVVKWPGVDQILNRLIDISYEELGRELGCTGNTIRKYVKRNGVEPPRFPKGPRPRKM